MIKWGSDLCWWETINRCPAGLRTWEDILSKASYQYQVTMRLYVCTRDNVKNGMVHAHSRTSDY